MNLARRMGMKDSLTNTADNYGLSFALGSAEVQLIEHTNMYASFANNGKYIPANPILKITDSQDNVLYEANAKENWEKAPQALRAEYAYQITSILTDNKARARIFTEDNLFGRTQSELGRPTAAKSGTTNDWKDIWTMGYTTDLAVGVWAGHTNGDGSPVGFLPEMDGITGAGPIWSNMMLEMHKNSSFSKYLNGPDGKPMPKEFPRPSGIYEGEVCVATGGKETGGFESHRELLVRDAGPALACDQLSVFQAKELDFVMKNLNQRRDRYVGGAVPSIQRYAEAVGYRSGSFGQGGTRGDSPQIQPRDGTIEESD